MACNTAIFYDIENLIGLFSSKTNTVLHLDEIYRRVLATEGVSGVSIQRAYADWGVPAHRNLRNSVLQVGIEPIQIFNTNQNDKVKNAADVSLIIDAVDLAARRSDIETFVIASGDGIFAFLSKKLHEYGKRVIGCSFEKIANSIFRNSCDTFIGLEKSDESIIATVAQRNTKPSMIASIAEKPIKGSKKKQKQPPTLPKCKYTDMLLAAEIDATQDLQDTAGVMHTVRRLVEVLFVDDTKDLPGLEISIFANYITYFMPGFRVRQLKFKGIGEFMRLMLSGSQYCTYSIEDNVVLMAPRAVAEISGGKIVDDVNGLLITTQDGERYNSIFNIPAGVPFIFGVYKEATKQVVKQTDVRVELKAESFIGKEAATPKGNLRKWIKDRFNALSAANKLPPGEARLLTAHDYCIETFGIRAPVFREVDPNNISREQRVNNGKIKYWKEPFQFNGVYYLVYKEWATLHKDRFAAWCAAYLS